MAQSMYIMFTVVLLSIMSQRIMLVQSQSVDATRTPGATGEDVAFASVSLIERSGIFPNDNRFLQRVAYAESRDGLDADTYREGYHGGIWQVDEAIFDKTQNITANPQLSAIHTALINNFDIVWLNLEWVDLRAPFFSALAARIYFEIAGEPIPRPGDIQGQAEFWKRLYNSNPQDTIQLFISRVNGFESEECQAVLKYDVGYVFDASGSVGAGNFPMETQFAVNLTDSLFTIGPDDTQVASILFSSSASVSFFLNTHNNRASVLQAIMDITFTGGGTNTAEALTTLRTEIFNPANGARDRVAEGVTYLAVVITDGQSNNAAATAAAADILHNDDILVFAVGIGSGVNMVELEAIASSPDLVIPIAGFDEVEFQGLLRTINADVCVLPSPREVTRDVEGTLTIGQVLYFEFQLPTIGMTIRFNISIGRVILFVSGKIQNPNSAFYDYKYDTGVDSRGVYISPYELSGNQDDRSDSTPPPTDAPVVFSNITVYFTVEGVLDQNSFVMVTTVGDTSTPSDSAAMGMTFDLAFCVTFALIALVSQILH